jgi:probable F420-dependent oxidoreductase
VDIDIWLPTASPYATPEVLAAVGCEADRRGIGTVWVGEHAVEFDDYDSSYPYAPDGKMPLPPDAGLLEPFTALAFLAAHTTVVRLGTGICVLPQRNPVYTAKEVATLDWLSGGRIDFGVGVGWLREEFEALNVPWSRRGGRTDEYLDLIQTLWTAPSSGYAGQYFTLPPCTVHPRPIQGPHPPIHIGGESDAALRRVARRGQGWLTFNRPPGALAGPLARLDELLAEVDRNRAELTITVCPYFLGLDADAVEHYAAAGADAVAAMVFVVDVEGVEGAFDALDPLIERARAC